MRLTKTFLIWIVFLCGALYSQVAAIRLQPDQSISHEQHDRSTAHAGIPVAGYVVGPGPLQIHSIISVAGTTKVGDSVPAPATSKQVFLPPTQQYALVERDSEWPLAVWALHKTATTGIAQDLISIPGAMAHPDLVAFGPRGQSAALYSQSAASIQVISHLPVEPVVSKAISTPGGLISKLAISDDGELLAKAQPGGPLSYSYIGGKWTTFPTGMAADGLSFVPKTHDLIISDKSQKTIALFPSLEKLAGANYRILGQGIEADRLMMTRGGERAITLDETGKVWSIDFKGGTTLEKEDVGASAELIPLRDGYTFLVVSSRDQSVLRLRAVPLRADIDR